MIEIAQAVDERKRWFDTGEDRLDRAAQILAAHGVK
jgi:hypothetical protein